MHTLKFLLNTSEYEKYVLEKRFYALNHIHNVMVKYARKLLNKLKHDQEYNKYLNQYFNLLKKPNKNKDELKELKDIKSELSYIRKSIGLSEYSFHSYIKVCARRYKKCISSMQVQKEASRVYKAVEKYLFSNGKEIHFKKNDDLKTIGGKSKNNGAIFKEENGKYHISFLGLKLFCKIPKNNLWYIHGSLKDDLSYVDIKREMFPNGWHYYAILILKGDAPKKIRPLNIGNDIIGIDPGVSTIAAYSKNKLFLRELAPNIDKYNKKIIDISRYLDNSKRANNPKKYNSNGTINKRNTDIWVYSKKYKKCKNKLKSIYRQKSAYIKQCHEILANEIIRVSNHILIEKMNFKSLQRKVKNTQRSNTKSIIISKNGTIKHIYKFKRKKRFGKTLNNRSPALFIEILKRKVELYNGVFEYIDTKKFKASQYNHHEDMYTKSKLSDRSKLIDDKYVQRDLYSAFLIANANDDRTQANREKCLKDFNNFLKLQDELIEDMKKSKTSMKQCFGF